MNKKRPCHQIDQIILDTTSIAMPLVELTNRALHLTRYRNTFNDSGR